METINEIKNQFNFLYNRITENSEDGNWIKIGEQIRHYPTDEKFTIMVNDSAKKPDLHNRNTFEFRKFSEWNVKYLNEDGSNAGSPGPYDDPTTELLPEYKDTYWDWFFNGLNETKEQEHQYFLSQLDIENGMVVLKHNSPYKIESGYVGGADKKGPNIYSNNSDLGNYFWGSKEEGADQSGQGEYQYICYVPIDEVYDFEYNEKGYKSMKEAVNNEKYVASWWPNGGGIVVVSQYPTKIDHVIKRRIG